MLLLLFCIDLESIYLEQYTMSITYQLPHLHYQSYGKEKENVNNNDNDMAKINDENCESCLVSSTSSSSTTKDKNDKNISIELRNNLAPAAWNRMDDTIKGNTPEEKIVTVLKTIDDYGSKNQDAKETMSELKKEIIHLVSKSGDPILEPGFEFTNGQDLSRCIYCTIDEKDLSTTDPARIVSLPMKRNMHQDMCYDVVSLYKHIEASMVTEGLYKIKNPLWQAIKDNKVVVGNEISSSSTSSSSSSTSLFSSPSSNWQVDEYLRLVEIRYVVEWYKYYLVYKATQDRVKIPIPILKQIQNTIVEALLNEDVKFAYVVDKLNPAAYSLFFKNTWKKGSSSMSSSSALPPFSFEEAPMSTTDKNNYESYIWTMISSPIKSTVRAVKYMFNHPSFMVAILHTLSLIKTYMCLSAFSAMHGFSSNDDDHNDLMKNQNPEAKIIYDKFKEYTNKQMLKSWWTSIYNLLLSSAFIKGASTVLSNSFGLIEKLYRTGNPVLVFIADLCRCAAEFIHVLADVFDNNVETGTRAASMITAYLISVMSDGWTAATERIIMHELLHSLYEYMGIDISSSLGAKISLFLSSSSIVMRNLALSGANVLFSTGWMSARLVPKTGIFPLDVVIFLIPFGGFLTIDGIARLGIDVICHKNNGVIMGRLCSWMDKLFGYMSKFAFGAAFLSEMAEIIILYLEGDYTKFSFKLLGIGCLKNLVDQTDLFSKGANANIMGQTVYKAETNDTILKSRDVKRFLDDQEMSSDQTTVDEVEALLRQNIPNKLLPLEKTSDAMQSINVKFHPDKNPGMTKEDKDAYSSSSVERQALKTIYKHQPHRNSYHKSMSFYDPPVI